MNTDLQIIEKRTSDHDSEQFEQLVLLEDHLSGYTDERDNWIKSRYAIQITTESHGRGDFVGLFDLDGERINLPNKFTWDLVEGEEMIADVPAEVLRVINSW